jgi:hypothetical protein
MVKASGFMTLTCLILGCLAVDIDLYPIDSQCGDLSEPEDLDFITCEDIAAGNCCYAEGKLFESCEATNPRKSIQAFAKRGEVFCSELIGAATCAGVSVMKSPESLVASGASRTRG